MDSSPEVDDSGTKKKRCPGKRDRSGTDVRRSGRMRVQRADKSDSERGDKRQKCIRWKTFEKQILLRSLQEKSAVAQFNYMSIKRLVKTKKQSDVEIYIKNIRKRAMKAKIETMRKKSPIEIWQDLMNHFGDADNHSIKDMSKVMVMASLERTMNCESITSNNFKPRRVYRYIAALFKSKELPTLTPLESQVILDCFENMLEVLKGSEIRDKAAFLRAQYFNLYNKAFTGGSSYSLEDNLSLVVKETESDQPHSSTSSSRPGTDPTTSFANVEKNRRRTDESVPGTSHTVPNTSGAERNESSATKKVLWRGGVDRSTEARILNPLGIPVEMLEFKHRDEESNSRKRWTYEYKDDSSDSDDSYSGWDDDEGGDSGGIEKRNGQVRRKRGGNSREDEAGKGEDNGQDSGGNGAGEPSGLQDMTEVLDTDQYAFVTEEEFTKKGKIYLQAMAGADAESDGNLDVSDLVNQYVFVLKDDLAREGEGFVQGLEETRGGENDASPEIRGLEDPGESIATDETHVSLDTESVRSAPSSSRFESEPFENDGQCEDDDSFGEGNTASEIDQSEVIDGSMDQSDFVANEIGRSDGVIDPNQPDELGVEMNLSDDEDSGVNPTEDTLSSTDTTIPPTCTPSPSEPIVGDDVMNLIPSISTSSLPEQPSRCENSMEVLTAVSLSSNQATVSDPIQTIASQVLPNQHLVSKSFSPRKIHDTDVPNPSTPSVPPHRSEAPGNVKSRAVQLLLPQKESQSNASSLQGTPDYSTPNTIPLANAINRGIVSSDQSDDQLLTIDVSQLGPDSNIVIPSYLLPGGILTIRSPDVSRMRIQRPDPSSLVQAGTDSAVANTQSSQSQAGVFQSSQSQDDMSADMGLERSDPLFSTQTETNPADANNVLDLSCQAQVYLSDTSQLHDGILADMSPGISEPSSLVQTETDSASTNNLLDLSCQAQVGVSCTSQSSDNILEDISPGSDAESMSEDDISQTEYVIASDHLSKESHHLCEVHVIASHILKPSNQAEVPLKTSPKVLHISKKCENSNISKGMHSEVIQAETEEGSFLDFLSSQKSALGWRKESTMPKGHLLKEKGLGNPQLDGQNVQVHSVNIPISKSWHDMKRSAVSKSLIGIGKTNVSHPLKISQHTPPEPSDILKHKGEIPPTTSSQPVKQVSLSSVGHETPDASGLHDIVTPKKRVGRPPKVRAETAAISRDVLENRVITEQGSSSTGEKRKRGRPAKLKSTITEQSLLVSEMQQGASVGVGTEGKRNRGRPRKADKRVSVDLEDSVLESVETQELTVKDLDGLEAIITYEGSKSASQEGVLAGEKRKPGRPPKHVDGNFRISVQEETKIENTVGVDINAVSNSLFMSSLKSQGRMISVGQPLDSIRKSIKVTFPNIKETLNEREEAVQEKAHIEKQKRGRPPKEQYAGTTLSLYNPPISAPLERCSEKENSNKGTSPVSTDLQRKVPNNQSGDLGWILYHPATKSLSGVQQKRKRGRPRKGSRPDSVHDLPNNVGLGQSIEKKVGVGELGTDSGSERKEKRKRGRPRKETQSYALDDLDDLQDSPVIRQSTENGISNGQFEDNFGTERKDKRKRGRPRKDSRPDSCDDIPGRAIPSQATDKGAGTGQFKTGTRSEREEKGQIESPHKEFRPYQPNISSPGNREKQNRGILSTGIRPKSCINMPDRDIAPASTVGRSNIDTANSKSEKMTVLQGSPFKLDKTKPDELETNARIEREEKRKRGGPFKGPETHSLVGMQKSMVKPMSTENEISIGELESDSQTEMIEKRKRGRPRKEATLDSSGDLQDRIAASRGTENEEGVGEFETASRVGGELKEKRRPTEIVLYQPDQLTDADKVIHQLQTVLGTEKRKRGRPRKHLNLTTVTDTSEGDWFDSIGQSKIDVQTEREGNEKKARPSKYLRTGFADSLLNRVTMSQSNENKTSTSPLRSGADSPEKPEVGSVGTDQTSKVTSDTASESEKQTTKRGRPRKELHRDSCDLGEVQGLSREHDTSDSHFEILEEQKSDEVHIRKTKIRSAEKEKSVGHSKSLTGRDEKRKRGRPRKLHKLNADSGSEKPENRKRGKPSKKVDTSSSNIIMRSRMMTSQSPEREVSMHHKEITSRTDGVDEQKRAKTCLEVSADSSNDSCHGLDILQTINSKGNDSVCDSELKIEGSGTRWRPLESLGLASTSHETSVSKPLPTTDSRTDQAPSELKKQVSLDKYLSSKKSRTHQAQGAIIPGILKKRKKRSPLKVNVGKHLANKKQKSLDRTRPSQASLARGRSTPFAKPLTDVLRRSDLVFGKPKKRVSFEDAIDLMGNLSDDEGLGKDLFMKDIVSHTAVKEVMKIVKQARVGRDSILEPQPERKTSIFFSIKKS